MMRVRGRTRRPGSLLIAAVTLTGLMASVATGANNPFAGGHGNLISGGELRTFSFAAVETVDGTASGQVAVKNRALDVRAQINVDCLKFESGNRAIVSGTITQSSNPALIIPGRVGVFGVEDNGEGAVAPVDRITTIPDYAPPKSCNEFTFVGSTLREVANPAVVVRTLTPIEDGNIQLQP
jgi:hypothetical protein